MGTSDRFDTTGGRRVLSAARLAHGLRAELGHEDATNVGNDRE